jgi:hypothetical protein
MTAEAPVIQDAPQYVPPVKCQPWCEYGDGHPTCWVREDQTCTTPALRVELSLEQRIGDLSAEGLPALSSLAELAEHLSFPRWKLRDASDLPRCNIFGGIYYRREHVADWIERNEGTNYHEMYALKTPDGPVRFVIEHNGDWAPDQTVDEITATIESLQLLLGMVSRA